MYPEEFKEYLEDRASRAYERFVLKALDYQNAKNAKRTPARKKWSDEKVEREAEKMWDDMVKDIYEKIKSNGNFKRRILHQEEIEDWISFMNENEILEMFSDSVDDLEFE